MTAWGLAENGNPARKFSLHQVPQVAYNVDAFLGCKVSASTPFNQSSTAGMAWVRAAENGNIRRERDISRAKFLSDLLERGVGSKIGEYALVF